MRIHIENICSNVDDEQRSINRIYSKHYPLVERCSLHGTKLAVAGGSPDIDIKGLREFNGDIWAINGAGKFLAENNISSTFITVDASITDKWQEWVKYATEALVASECDKTLFDCLEGKDVRIFHTSNIDGGINGGTTTACRIPLLALKLGYAEIHYFGCSGSFEKERTHAYMKQEFNPDTRITILAGKEFHVSNLEFMLQSEYLAMMIREFPKIFFNRSGGLLKGMVEHFKTWEITEVSNYINNNLKGITNDTTLPNMQIQN